MTGSLPPDRADAVGPSDIAPLLERLERAAPRLRARSASWVGERLALVWADVLQTHTAQPSATSALAASCGLSEEGARWALEATLGADTLPAALGAAALELDARVDPGAVTGPLALVLAGNVFTACVAPISRALMARAPLLVKTASGDDALPVALRASLVRLAPELAEACAVVTWSGGDESVERAVLGRAALIEVYGSDETLASLTRRSAPEGRVIGHGHGLGAGFVPAAVLADEERTRAAARGFALDVAAYDQRGCMSPQTIYLESGSLAAAQPFASALAVALDELESRLPRGALPVDAAAAQMQWRGVHAATSQLIEGDTFAVAITGVDASSPRSPGYRNVAVASASSLDAIRSRLAPLSDHLKAIGAPAGVDAAVLLPAETPRSRVRLCDAGQMQRPPLFDTQGERIGEWLVAATLGRSGGGAPK